MFLKYTFHIYISQTCSSIICCQYTSPIYIANTLCKKLNYKCESCMSARGMVDKKSTSIQGIANPKPDDPKIPVEVVWILPFASSNIYPFYQFGPKLQDCRSILKVWSYVIFNHILKPPALHIAFYLWNLWIYISDAFLAVAFVHTCITQCPFVIEAYPHAIYCIPLSPSSQSSLIIINKEICQENFHMTTNWEILMKPVTNYFQTLMLLFSYASSSTLYPCERVSRWVIVSD